MNLLFNALLLSYVTQGIDENIIHNTCKFNKLRISSNEILCVDYGNNKKYCKSSHIPDEFIILREYGIDYEEKIVIKPKYIYSSKDFDEKIIAKYYYNFNCDNNTKETKLIVNIIPTFGNDKSKKEELFELFSMITIIFLIYFVIAFLLSFKNDHHHQNDHNYQNHHYD